MCVVWKSAIVGWQYYFSRSERLRGQGPFGILKKFTRMRRLPLLRAIPLERLSPAGQRLLQEEKRAFPDTPYSDLSTFFVCGESIVPCLLSK